MAAIATCRCGRAGRHARARPLRPWLTAPPAMCY